MLWYLAISGLGVILTLFLAYMEIKSLPPYRASDSDVVFCGLMIIACLVPLVNMVMVVFLGSWILYRIVTGLWYMLVPENVFGRFVVWLNRKVFE